MTPSNSETLSLFLLSIRGKLVNPDLEASRNIHNATAGDPGGVEAARSLGDLSHQVYVPLDPKQRTGGDFLILDIWSSIEGLRQFFSDPGVQAGGARIFSERQPEVWAPAEGFTSYHLPIVSPSSERIVALVYGTVTSQAQARTLHNSLVAQHLDKARRAGHLSHEAYFKKGDPAVESLEFFAVDVWMDAAGMAQHYQQPAFLQALQGMFASAPANSIWVRPTGNWVEW